MKKDKKISAAFYFAAMGLIVALGIGLRIKQAIDDHRPVKAAVVIGDHRFEAEVADTPGKKELGLGQRDALAAGAGMYFPFPSAQYWVFWMKGMRFPIDIIWIRDGKVVDINRDAPPPKGEENPATFSPIGQADAVLEVNAGASAGIKVGDDVRLDPL